MRPPTGIQASWLRRLLRAVLAALVLSVPVAVLALLVRERFDPLIDADAVTTVAATDITRSRGMGTFWIVVQAVTQPTWLYVVAFAVTAWVGFGRRVRSRALWAAVTMVFAWNFGVLVKVVVHRARPVVADPISHAAGYSFPSGHAFNATVVVVTMWLLLSPLVRAKGRRRYAVVLGCAVVLLAGMDRVFLGVHFLSDVVAGVLLGAGITVGSWHGFIGRWAPVR